MGSTLLYITSKSLIVTQSRTAKMVSRFHKQCCQVSK